MMSYKENWVCLNRSITYTPMLDFAQIDSTKPQSRKKMHLPNKDLERDSRKKLNLEAKFREPTHSSFLESKYLRGPHETSSQS